MGRRSGRGAARPAARRGRLLAIAGGSIAAAWIISATAASPPTASPPTGPPPAGPPSTAPRDAGRSSATGATSASGSETPSARTTGTPPADASGRASLALAGIPVKGRAPLAGYDRALFGPAWYDADGNGCDTRNDILRRDLTERTMKAGTGGCVVLSGTLHDPYSGRTLAFVRGTGTSSAVQIDHVVALGDAWQKGAQQLSSAQRVALANDPLNLLAVSGSANQAKGNGDAATWLPAAKPFRCAYVARQVAVKVKYRLWMTQAEHDAVQRILATCPGQGLPAG